MNPHSLSKQPQPYNPLFKSVFNTQNFINFSQPNQRAFEETPKTFEHQRIPSQIKIQLRDSVSLAIQEQKQSLRNKFKQSNTQNLNENQNLSFKIQHFQSYASNQTSSKTQVNQSQHSPKKQRHEEIYLSEKPKFGQIETDLNNNQPKKTTMQMNNKAQIKEIPKQNEPIICHTFFQKTKKIKVKKEIVNNLEWGKS